MPQGKGTYGTKKGRPPKKTKHRKQARQQQKDVKKEIKKIDLINQKIIHSNV